MRRPQISQELRRALEHVERWRRGAGATARTLHLNYERLKDRMASAPVSPVGKAGGQRPPGFVEVTKVKMECHTQYCRITWGPVPATCKRDVTSFSTDVGHRITILRPGELTTGIQPGESIATEAAAFQAWFSKSFQRAADQPDNCPALSFANPHSKKTGRPIDLDFKGAEAGNILRLLSNVGELKLPIPPELAAALKTKITIKVANAPWDETFDRVARDAGLGWERQDDSIRLYKIGS